MLRSTVLAWLCLLFGPATATAGEPVFLAPIVAGHPDDRGVVDRAQEETRERLLGRGWVVLDADSVAAVVPRTEVSYCGIQPLQCASAVLPLLPVRVGVMARVDRVGQELVGHVEYVAPNGKSAMRSVDLSVLTGSEDLFADEIVRVLGEVVAPLDSAPAEIITDATRVVSGQVDPTAGPVASAGAPAPRREPVDLPKGLDTAGVARRRFAGARQRLSRSGLHPLDFIHRSTPHAGQAVIELRAGFGWGDVDRQVYFRDEVRDGETTNRWYREAPAEGTDFLGGGYIGYAPITALDFGVLFGFQYASRVVNAQTLTLTGPGDTPDREEPALSLVQAIDVVVQPRVRLYAVALGPVKPYVVAGGELKRFQGYEVPVEAIGPPGGWIPGAVGGLGVVLDPGPLVGFFAEGTYTLHFGPRTAEVTDSGPTEWQWLASEPPLSDNLGGTITVTGGVQFRL